jgi:hypothetical protein
MFLIAALILLFCGPWFSDQHTVGLILLIPGIFELIPWFIVAGIFGSVWKRT